MWAARARRVVLGAGRVLGVYRLHKFQSQNST
nr:MAG TPA: hypothetical protein [Caudoviricetes sp.]